MDKPPSAEKALKTLQQTLRQKPSEAAERPAAVMALPAEPSEGEGRFLVLSIADARAVTAARVALMEDPRFEYLKSRVDDVLREFVAQCRVERRQGHIERFVTDHARLPQERLCYMPLEHLRVAQEVTALGTTFLPTTDARIPRDRIGFSLVSPVGSVAAVLAHGTSEERMAERAMAACAYALRLLRVGLTERIASERQLRFRLAGTYTFSEPVWGWKASDDVAYDLDLTPDLIRLAESQPMARIGPNVVTDVDRKAQVALKWIERSLFAAEPMVALLFLFFGLEALLGDRSSKKKAHDLAFKQALLNHVVTGAFAHPDRTVLLYDRVRSAAVHGEDVHGVTWGVVHDQVGAVKTTLDAYVAFADAQGIGRRGRLLTALARHPGRAQLIDWLRVSGGEEWRKWLERDGAAVDPDSR